jgi:tetrahydromethanopterin S-methyltransferase subunit B
MYDTTDGKKASILKDVDTTASDSIYAYKPSTTIVMNTPRYNLNCPHCGGLVNAIYGHKCGKQG